MEKYRNSGWEYTCLGIPPPRQWLSMDWNGQQWREKYGSDARGFIEHHLYVDDGLNSFSSSDEVINIFCRDQKMLAKCNILLHKISANCPIITSVFPSEDLATDMQIFGKITPPI